MAEQGWRCSMEEYLGGKVQVEDQWSSGELPEKWVKGDCIICTDDFTGKGFMGAATEATGSHMTMTGPGIICEDCEETSSAVDTIMYSEGTLSQSTRKNELVKAFYGKGYQRGPRLYVLNEVRRDEIRENFLAKLQETKLWLREWRAKGKLLPPLIELSESLQVDEFDLPIAVFTQGNRHAHTIPLHARVVRRSTGRNVVVSEKEAKYEIVFVTTPDGQLQMSVNVIGLIESVVESNLAESIIAGQPNMVANWEQRMKNKSFQIYRL